MTVAAYYDTFHDRLIDDYNVRNRRVVAALDFAREALTDAYTVLDVGCGIGWTSAEIADTGKHVIGLDISPVLVATARSMFGHRCRFVVGDFAHTSLGRFSAVLMIDVYEHFHREVRPLIHRRLRNTEADRVVLTAPTPQALQSARDQGIELQPIDEDVTDEDVERIASDIGGHVAINRVVSIWADDDYRHVLITRP